MADTGSLLMSQLVDVARREKERLKTMEKEEEAAEEKDQKVPGTPVVEPATPVASESRDLGGEEEVEDEKKAPQRTNSGRLRRQQHSVIDGEGRREGGREARYNTYRLLHNLEQNTV